MLVLSDPSHRPLGAGRWCILLVDTEPGMDWIAPDFAQRPSWPDCPKTDDQWDRCGVYYVEPIEAGL